jgi:hypothetical protein
MENMHYTPEKTRNGNTEVYIEYLIRSLGATRQEIIEVVHHSGISSRRIAEYLIKQKVYSVNDDE